MTSLIDVIFLLLLFFMLSSTFSRFAELDLVTAGGGGVPPEGEVLFLRVAGESVSLNGQALALDRLGEAIRARGPEGLVLVSLAEGTTAQALVDVLVVLRRLPGVAVTVLEAV